MLVKHAGLKIIKVFNSIEVFISTFKEEKLQHNYDMSKLVPRLAQRKYSMLDKSKLVARLVYD